MSDLYDTDIVPWAEQQAALLRRRAQGDLINDAELDWQNIAEEIEDVSRRDRDRLYGALRTACTHLLKWQFQPAMRSNAWRAAIVKARSRVVKLIKDSPTLRPYPAAVIDDAYADALRIAEAETGLANLPRACPWTIEQVLDHEFWPEPLAP